MNRNYDPRRQEIEYLRRQEEILEAQIGELEEQVLAPFVESKPGYLMSTPPVKRNQSRHHHHAQIPAATQEILQRQAQQIHFKQFLFWLGLFTIFVIWLCLASK